MMGDILGDCVYHTQVPKRSSRWTGDRTALVASGRLAPSAIVEDGRTRWASTGLHSGACTSYSANVG